MIKLVIFDIDDTLYLERDFVRSGFLECSMLISKKYKMNKEDVYNKLVKLFEISSKNIFDRFFIEESVPISIEEKQEIMDRYRFHTPNISLSEKNINVLEDLKKKGYKLSIVSDGNYLTQSNKVVALGLEKYFDKIILTDKFGKEYWKPSILPFQILRKNFDVEYEEMLYIGDNPKKDFYISQSLKITTIRYVNPEQVYLQESYLENIKENYMVTDLDDISKLLKMLE